MNVEGNRRVYEGEDVFFFGFKLVSVSQTSFGKSERYEVLSFACLTVDGVLSERCLLVAFFVRMYKNATSSRSTAQPITDYHAYRKYTECLYGYLRIPDPQRWSFLSILSRRLMPPHVICVGGACIAHA